jgi:hypothetical protein
MLASWFGAKNALRSAASRSASGADVSPAMKGVFPISSAVVLA